MGSLIEDFDQLVEPTDNEFQNDLRISIRARLIDIEKPCVWTKLRYHVLRTGCGGEWNVPMLGAVTGPAAHIPVYCPICGRRVLPAEVKS